MIFIRKGFAFLKRDFIIEKNYHLAFFMKIFNIVATIALFYFMSKLFGNNPNLYLERYKGDFFTFLLIGLAFARLLNAWLNSFSDSLQTELYTGSLEIMLSTPLGIFEILFFPILWNQFYVFVQVLLFIFTGIFFFKAHIVVSGCILALVIVLISMPIFMGLGIISASLVIIFKRGDILKTVFFFFLTFLSGVYFPVEILPIPLQRISYILPTTSALKSIREVLINGHTINFIYRHLVILIIFAVIIFPLSLYIFKKAFKKAQAEGSLTHY